MGRFRRYGKARTRRTGGSDIVGQRESRAQTSERAGSCAGSRCPEGRTISSSTPAETFAHSGPTRPGRSTEDAEESRSVGRPVFGPPRPMA